MSEVTHGVEGDLETFDLRRSYPGKGLLTTQWGQGADAVVHKLRLAYKQIGDEKAENVIIWNAVRGEVQTALLSRFNATGLWLPRIDLHDLFDRAAPEHWERDALAHVRLVRALLTDYTDSFWGHIEDRLGTGANVHFDFMGETGSGKSSSAVTVADWMSPITPNELFDHLNFDLGELQDKLVTKKPRQAVIQDEFIAQTGEGARTAIATVQSIEDTLRASQVSLFTCSPGGQEEKAMRLRLETVAYNPRDHWTLFMVWKLDKPRGVVAIPWMRTELYEKYRQFKEENVKRSLSGAFQDRDWVIRKAVRFFEDPHVVDYLKIMIKGRTYQRADFERALRTFRGDNMSVTQREAVAHIMVEMVLGYKRAEPNFQRWFGVEVPNGLRILAGKNERAHEEDKEDGE